GPFNSWGNALRPEDTLLPVSGTPYYATVVKDLKHLMQYRLLVNGSQRLDPAARFFTTPDFLKKFGLKQEQPFLNCVFWDFGRPGAYRMRTKSVDLRRKPVIIAETEVYELARNW